MDWLWTWGGECFGYRVNDRLFVYHGMQVGRFDATPLPSQIGASGAGARGARINIISKVSSKL